jgi:hypothetical protein
MLTDICQMSGEVFGLKRPKFFGVQTLLLLLP